MLEGQGLVETLVVIKWLLVPLFLALFWSVETWKPFFPRSGRLRHAVPNIVLALGNTLCLGLLVGALTVWVCDWTAAQQLGLLQAVSEPWQVLLGLVLLDAWMYSWHRGNHRLPLLWRFHRMHHSDAEMDVTTATRFHVGELLCGALLRLGLIPLLGLKLWHLLVYEMLVTALTQFHHANIDLGSWDCWLNWIIVTPNMHRIHHSRLQAETDSNYATVLSFWDRLAHSFRTRADQHAIQLGLAEWSEPRWQSLWGMLQTPFRRRATQRADGRTENSG